MTDHRAKLEDLAKLLLALRVESSALRRNPEIEILPPRPGLDASGLAQLANSWTHPLPPSYRNFLLAHDGWENADGQGTFLLGSADRKLQAVLKKIEDFKNGKYRNRIKNFDELWFVAVGDSGLQFLYLDAGKCSKDGEMDLVLFDAEVGEILRYQSIIGWFEGKIRHLHGVIDVLKARQLR